MKPMRRPFACLILSLPVFGGCFGSCSGPLRESTELACVTAKAPAGSHDLRIGSDEAGKAFAPIDGATLHLDYGSQGGMHFYYSLRIYGATKESLIRARFYPDVPVSPSTSSVGSGSTGAQTTSTSGGAGGSVATSSASSGATSSGATTSSGGGGAGGAASTGPKHCQGEHDAPDCYEGEFIFLYDQLKVPTCAAGEWLELKNKILQVYEAGPVTGTLVIEIGTCPTQGCQSDGNGDYLLDVQASAQVKMGYVP